MQTNIWLLHAKLLHAKEWLLDTPRKLLDKGYSMTDLGRELGITRQAVHDLLRRAKESQNE
jgi:predicted DNA-binding protein YlxM (UPF0122 family)